MKPAQRVGLLFVVTMAYAVLRYNVCGGVGWEQVPVYILNKSVSWLGLLLFGMSMLAQEKTLRRYYGTRASIALLIHVVLSLMILNPSYFSKFFQPNGLMTLGAELSMLAGAVGFVFVGALVYVNGREAASPENSLRAGWGRMVLGCGALHVAAMGYAGWLAPATWHGYLPPISLLSFLSALYYLYCRQRRRAE